MSDTAADATSSGEQLELGATEPAQAPVDGATAESDEAEQSETTTEQLYTVKVHGEEKQIPLAEIIKGYQSIQAAQQKFQEAAAVRKQVEAQAAELVSDLRSNPFAVLGQLGIDLDSHIEAWAKERMEEAELSEEGKELKRLKAEREAWKAEKEQSEARSKRERAEQVAHSIRQWTEDAMPEDIPKNNIVAAAIREELGRLAHAEDFQGFDADIVKTAVQSVSEQFRALLPKVDAPSDEEPDKDAKYARAPVKATPAKVNGQKPAKRKRYDSNDMYNELMSEYWK